MKYGQRSEFLKICRSPPPQQQHPPKVSFILQTQVHFKKKRALDEWVFQVDLHIFCRLLVPTAISVFPSQGKNKVVISIVY